jgi:tetratricopeptide (TPR) repeat protein
MTYQLGMNIGVAYWAHIGGVLFGAAFAAISGLEKGRDEDWVLVEPETDSATPPSREGPILETVESLMHDGDYEEAISYCKDALEMMPENYEARLALHRAYRLIQRREEALQELFTLLEQLAMHGERDMLITAYDELREFFPDETLPPEVAYKVALACAAKMRGGDAAFLLIPIIERSAGTEASPGLRARALFQMGKLQYDVNRETKLGREYFEKFLSEFPEHEWVGVARDYLSKIH